MFQVRRHILGTAVAAIAVFGGLMGAPSVSAQESVSSSVTVTAYVCPEGMTAETLDPSQCTVETGGFNLLIGSLEGEMIPYDIGDATEVGDSFVWDLGLQQPDTSTRWFVKNEVVIVPDTTYIVTGDVVGPVDGSDSYRFDTSYEAPNPVLNVFNFISSDASLESTITIHQRICDSSYDGGDLFTECHGNILGEAYELSVGSEVKATDPATGNVTFTVTGESAAMADSSGADVDFILSRQVYCAYTESGEPLEISSAGEGVGYGTVVYFAPGSDVTCDWYQFASTLAPTDPTPTATVTATATAVASVTPAATGTPVVTTLPSTGAGSANGSAALGFGVIAGGLLLFGFAVAIRKRAI